ncbi:unnamed protein product [Vitrella brassicaformis CCMP3155]|uniref:Uncharacterized protein n=2 Tax=Vitrella brassicaformis TaxID=1169539 RepID=A0A0G4FSM3_VITBC|nr:unnamed protein product [Vitrella brassicaformis CCMP3155]|eukprot:CEM17717.1 unnamed protein product [Vitrella brassicaformis CCMP3155]
MALVERDLTIRFAGDGAAGAPLVIKESVARLFKYFESMLDGPFIEGQEGEICLDGLVSRRTAEVVLRPEPDIVTAITKDTFIEALVALDFFQFEWDSDTRRVTGQSLLTRIQRKALLCGRLDDADIANGLLDSFGDNACVAELILGSEDVPRCLAPWLINRPLVIQEHWQRRLGHEWQWQRCSHAAIWLLSGIARAISHGQFDVSRQQLDDFLTAATGSSTIAEAHASVWEEPTLSWSLDIIDLYPFDDSTDHPLVTDLPSVILTAGGYDEEGHNPGFGLALEPSRPPEDTMVSEVRTWSVSLTSCQEHASRTRFADCFGASSVVFEVDVPDSGDPARVVVLHDAANAACGIDSDPASSVTGFGVTLLQANKGMAFTVDNLTPEALQEMGVREVTLKDVRMKVWIPHFPMRALSLHCLRKCVEDNHWEGVAQMASAIDSEVAKLLLVHLSHTKPRPYALMASWAKGIRGAPSVDKWTWDELQHALPNPPRIEHHIADIPALIPSVLPMLDDHQRKALWSAVSAGTGHRPLHLVKALMEYMTAKEAELRSVRLESLRQQQTATEAAHWSGKLEDIDGLHDELHQVKEAREAIDKGGRSPTPLTAAITNDLPISHGMRLLKQHLHQIDDEKKQMAVEVDRLRCEIDSLKQQHQHQVSGPASGLPSHLPSPREDHLDTSFTSAPSPAQHWVWPPHE